MNDKLIYLISAEPAENESLSGYFRKHNFNCRIYDGLDSAEAGIAGQSPDLIILAGSSIPSPDICGFAAVVEQICNAPIVALLTSLQMSIVVEMAESENLWTAEYPISLREIRALVDEAFAEIAG